MKKLKTVLAITITLLLLINCGKKNKSKIINGAGASFPFPIYSDLFETYHSKTKIKVNYQSIGSGGGIKQISEDTVDFGATDAFIDDAKLKKINGEKGRKLLHVPTLLGGITIVYNIANNPELKLDGKTIASIFMGKTKKWNDPLIQKLNPDEDLPSEDIIVVRRSDGSGTTFAFSDFLANQSLAWKKKVGVGKSLEWFKGSIGSKGNEGVTGSVNQTKNSIGYVSLNYALQSKLKVADVKNNNGNFITPTVESVSLAAQTTLPEDTRIKLTSIKKGNANAYPISTFTWLVFYQEQAYNERSKELAQEVKKLLTWVVSKEAQETVDKLHYAPLPPSTQEQAIKIINQITYKEEKI